MEFGFNVATIIYMYISIFIFLIGWVKPIFSIPTVLILLFFIVKYIKDKKEINKEKKPIYISIKMLIFITIIVVLLGTIFGWTRIFTQTTDWYKHNSVINDLTNKNWPVYYENGNEHSMLTYYIGQYMFPSLIGKIFSSALVAQVANGVWAMVGLFIAILGIFKITKSDNKEKQIITLGITILFSTCLILSQSIGKIIAPDQIYGSGHWLAFLGDIRLQLSSNPVLLRWVMPQVIIPWLTLCLLYDEPYDIKNYILIFLPVVFYSTLPFIGLALVLVVLTIIKLIKERNKILNVIKEIFSLSNIFIMCTLGVILILYFYGNIFMEKPKEVGLSIINYNGHWVIYILYILTILPYAVLLFKKNMKNPLYWVSTAMLVVLPFIKMGLYNDFVMRVSIIPLFIYMILAIKMLYDKDENRFKKIVLIIFILIGSYSSMVEIADCFKINTDYSVSVTLENTANRELKDVSNDLKYNYYSYDIDNNLFYKFLAR